jgi:hypothetical protein
MPTFHPAYLLRNQALTEKRKVWEDMLQVMEKLQLPISEKQRGYFLVLNQTRRGPCRVPSTPNHAENGRQQGCNRCLADLHSRSADE